VLPQLSDQLLERWDTLSLRQPRPESISYIGLPGAVEGGTTTFLACGRQVEPLFAVKLFRHGGARAATEALILRHLQVAAPWSHGRVPRLVFQTSIAGTAVLVESIVAGRPVMVRVRADGLPDPVSAARDFRSVSSWLLRLRASAPVVSSERVDVSALAARFEALFRPGPAERRLLADLSSAEPMGQSPILHGDLCRQNILRSGEGPDADGVIDWTDAEVGALPAEDLLFFITTYFVQARGAGFDTLVDGFEETFFGAHAYAVAVRSAFVAYCAAAGIESDLRRHLGLLLVRQAVRQAERLEALSATQPLPRFAVWLAAANRLDNADAQRASMWLYYFRRLAMITTQASGSAA
jgi:hypothetical protein